MSGPSDPEPRGATAETRLRVRSYELDSFDHVNHAVFLNWFEQARFEALEQGGLPLDTLTSMGLAVVVVRVEVDYRAEARLGDRVLVRTRVGEVRKSSMTLEQEAVRVDAPGGTGAGRDRVGPDDEADESAGADAPAETRLAEARVVAVWLREGRPVRVPAEVREALGVS